MRVPADDIEARLEAFRATGDPATLWPHMNPPDREAAHTRITAVTRTVLNHPEARPKLEARSAAEVTATGIAAFVSGMGALLGHWIESGLIEADRSLTDLLTEHLAHGRRRSKKLTAALASVVDTLSGAGITPTVFKGAHTAHSYFPEPGTRPASDIDLLVHPDQFTEARAALREAGFVERRRPTGPDRSEWIPPGAPQRLQSLELDHADSPWSVDLHTELKRRYFRGRTAGFGNRAHADTALWKIDGRTAGVLAQPLLTAYAALNTSHNIHELRLLHLVELVFIVRRDTAAGTLEWNALAEVLARTETDRFVYPALELTERLVPGSIDPGVREQIGASATAKMRRVVGEIQASDVGGFIPRSLTEKLMWARGPIELAKNIAELVWPSSDPSSTTSRGRTYGRRLTMLRRGRIAIRPSRNANDAP